MRQKLVIFGAVAVALTLCCAAQQAEASILAQIVEHGSPYPTGAFNSLEDADQEKITKGKLNTADEFEVGDTVELHLDFNTISSTSLYISKALDEILAAYPNYQLSAVGEFTITAINNVAGGLGDFVFDGWIDVYEVGDKTVDPDGGGPLADGDVEFSEGVSGTRDTIMAGTKVLSLGIATADDFIVAWDAPIAFADIPGSGTTSPVATLFGLSVLGSQDLGLLSDAMLSTGSVEDGLTDTFHDVTGVNTFSANGVISDVAGDLLEADEYELRSNTDINFMATVPEPASMLVWAGLISLIGFVGLRRRK